MRKSPILYPEFSRYGTSTTLDLTQALGIYPAKNWTATGVFTPADKIGGYAIEAPRRGQDRLRRLPGGLQPDAPGQGGAYAGFFTEGPEYETLYSLRRGHRGGQSRRHHRLRPHLPTSWGSTPCRPA